MVAACLSDDCTVGQALTQLPFVPKHGGKPEGFRRRASAAGRRLSAGSRGNVGPGSLPRL